VLSAELRRCAECRNEFDALSATLRITNRSRELSALTDEYWTNYHAKLRQNLVNATALSASHKPSVFERFIRFSIPVPAPVALALIIACAIAVPVAVRAARQQTAQPPLVVHIPVEVPVIQEKVVTRVVYRERRPIARTSKRTINAPQGENTFAKSERAESPAGFAGFKPTEEVKLTVIKGRNWK
jgi:hypothetical protein